MLVLYKGENPTVGASSVTGNHGIGKGALTPIGGKSVGVESERVTGSARKGPLYVVGFHVRCVIYMVKKVRGPRKLKEDPCAWRSENRMRGTCDKDTEESSEALGSH